MKLLGQLLLAVFAIAALGQSPAAAQTTDKPGFGVPGLLIIWGADDFSTSGSAPVVSDLIIDSGSGTTAASSGDTDLISGDVHTVVTGTLAPTEFGLTGNAGAPFLVQRSTRGNFNTDINRDGILSGDDSFNAFTIRSNSDINTRRAELTSSFFVASNVPFAIDAVATPIGATDPDTLNRMRVRMRVSRNGNNNGFQFGSAAQFPHSGGAAGGIRANFRRLSTMRTPFPIFTGNQRTARTRGSIVQQSVRFNMTYRFLSGNIDLSDGVIDAAAEVVYTAYIP